MNEMKLGTLAVIGLIICCIDCWFWMAGGRSGKYKRRFIGSFIQITGINILALIVGVWHWLFIVAIIPEIASRCMGYGVHSE